MMPINGNSLPTLFARITFKYCRRFVALSMLAAVIAVYWAPSAEPGSYQIGLDYIHLHSRRMQFARDALLASVPVLPGWYPRELLGTPFWSNIQNFPFIPTRLLVLLTMEPMGEYTYSAAISLSAMLAALFTYLYLRKLGMGPLGSAVAGWTFACSGFYASRVAAGHLSILEGYPALPLLLWGIESQLRAQEEGKSSRRWMIALAIATCCVSLAGHPQLPVYALAGGLLYTLWRARLNQMVQIAASMALGLGLAGFALVPMAMLIGRSTRILPLATAANDLAMPYRRLAAFFFPWHDGAPPPLELAQANRFHGYPDQLYFWDTVFYTGLLPWVAMVLLCWLAGRRIITTRDFRIWSFVVILFALGILLSFPAIQQVTSLIPGTYLRSPVRITYFTVFALAVIAGAGVQLILKFWKSPIARLMIALLLILHIIDLAYHDRHFVLRGTGLAISESLRDTLRHVGDGRIAVDYQLSLATNRTIDDVGFFDSIMLARPYRWILSLTHAPEDLNIENLSGSRLPSRALEAAGVRFVVTASERKDLLSEGQSGEIHIYRVLDSAPRAQFFDASKIRYLTDDEIYRRLRDFEFDFRTMLLLPERAAVYAFRSERVRKPESPRISYRRPDSDHIEVTVANSLPGVLRIIESWDPGWSATVNGSAVPIFPALNALLSVPLNAGNHEIRFVYNTPGATAGQIISILSLVLVCALIWRSPRKQPVSDVAV